MDHNVFSDLYSALLRHFTDPAVDELLINGERGLWLVTVAGCRAVASPFADRDMLTLWVQELARSQDLRLDPLSGAAGGSLGEQSYRWHALLPPLSPDGTLLSIRRHRFAAVGLEAFAVAPGVAADLRTAMLGRCNLLLAGPTGSGKTTLLAALLRDYAPRERVILVESLAELPLPSPLSVRLLERRPNLEGVGGVSLQRLVHEGLRLRPDRLVIGEVRSHEAAAYLEAVMSGHGGVMTTLHAETADDARARLSLLARRAGWRRPPSGWQGIPLAVVVLGRGQPPQIHSVTFARFVPSA